MGESDANITRSDNRDNGRSRNDYDSRKSGDTRRGERRGGFLNTRGRGRGRGLEFRGPRRGSLRGRGGRGSDRRPFRPERSSVRRLVNDCLISKYLVITQLIGVTLLGQRCLENNVTTT